MCICACTYHTCVKLSLIIWYNNYSTDDDALDRFADAIDDNKSDVKGNAPTDGDGATQDQVMWQYKWTNSEDAEIFGPYSSDQMDEWSKAE